MCCGAASTEELITLCCRNESEIGPAEWDEKVKLKNQSMVSKASPTSQHFVVDKVNKTKRYVMRSAFKTDFDLFGRLLG